MTHTLRHPSRQLRGHFFLPASKSESNRMLILQALSRGMIQLDNLSTAKDSQTLEGLLLEDPETMDVGHAGTAMRFLTAFLAFRPHDKVLMGSARMHERPIGLLVDALRQMGADIQYMDRDGYPPLMIFGRNARFGDRQVSIPGHVSSQYISALLMIAPTLPDGLSIEITGVIGSRPYIEMTLALMARFGVQHRWERQTIHVPRQMYRAGNYTVESDWSAASYWFCMAGLASAAEIRLSNLRSTSLQGDSAVMDMVAPLGIHSEWLPDGDLLIRKFADDLPKSVDWDFSACPDLAQGLLVMLAARGIRGRFTGLESLRIKETDRIAALQNELGKFGAQLLEGDGVWQLSGDFRPLEARIPTYEDHRMAMAFAPLAMACPKIIIEEPEVVVKSYPEYWVELAKAGFELS